MLWYILLSIFALILLYWTWNDVLFMLFLYQIRFLIVLGVVEYLQSGKVSNTHVDFKDIQYSKTLSALANGLRSNGTLQVSTAKCFTPYSHYLFKSAYYYILKCLKFALRIFFWNRNIITRLILFMTQCMSAVYLRPCLHVDFTTHFASLVVLLSRFASSCCIMFSIFVIHITFVSTIDCLLAIA